MKDFKIFSLNSYIIFLSALAVGMLAGEFCPACVHIYFRTVIHNVYVKFHPDSQKDTKTIIMEKTTKGIPDYTGTGIFDEPAKKDSGFVYVIKKVLHSDKKEQDNLNLIIN